MDTIATKDLTESARKLINTRKKKVFVIVAEDMTVPRTAGLWEGGSRDVYNAFDWIRKEAKCVTDMFSFHTGREDRKVTLGNGIVVIKSGTFCGKDATPILYVHPTEQSLFAPKDKCVKDW